MRIWTISRAREVRTRIVAGNHEIVRRDCLSAVAV